MTVLVIEDELLGAKALKNLLIQIDNSIEVLAIKDSIQSSAKWLLTNSPPDLMFMDIELVDGQCFEIFKEVKIDSPVIFTTSYDEYALQAFQFNSVDYLLKPINPEDLKRSLAKVQTLRQQLGRNTSVLPQQLEQLIQHFNSSQPAVEYRERFLVKQGQRLFSIGLPAIAYFFSKGKITHIKSKDNKQYFLDYTLDELEPILSPAVFFRLNRQVIASHDSVLQVHTWHNGKLKVFLSPEYDEEVVVSREKAREFRKWMGE